MNRSVPLEDRPTPADASPIEPLVMRPLFVPQAPANRLTLTVSHGDMEAELPIAVEDFHDRVTPRFEPAWDISLARPFPQRIVELPRPRIVDVRTTPLPLPVRVQRLPLAARVALVCAWLVLVGAVGATVSRIAWRATASQAAPSASNAPNPS